MPVDAGQSDRVCGGATPDNRAPQPTSFFKETSGKCTCQVADDRARTGSERPTASPEPSPFARVSRRPINSSRNVENALATGIAAPLPTRLKFDQRHRPVRSDRTVCGSSGPPPMEDGHGKDPYGALSGPRGRISPRLRTRRDSHHHRLSGRSDRTDPTSHRFHPGTAPRLRLGRTGTAPVPGGPGPHPRRHVRQGGRGLHTGPRAARLRRGDLPALLARLSDPRAHRRAPGSSSRSPPGSGRTTSTCRAPSRTA